MAQTLDLRTARTAKIVRYAAAFVAVALFMMLGMLVNAHAAGDASRAIQQGITTASQQLYNIMTAVVLPVAVVVFTWTALMVFAGGERGMEQAKKKMLMVIGVLALVYLAPVIISQVGGWFSGQGDAGVFSGAL